MPAAVETAAPEDGDGDSGGIPDAVQANVASLPAAVDLDGNGLLDDYVTIESPAGTVLTNVTAVPVPTDPAPPAGVVFPVGLFDYEVVVANPGDPADVTFHLPEGVVGGEGSTGFWVLQNGQWTDLTPSSDADAVADEVTVELVDGAAGDADRQADGVIEDPGGPGTARAPGTITVTVAAVLPAYEFNFFLEECAETGLATACTSQDPRRWIDPVSNQATAITEPEPVTLRDGQSFTWGNLVYDRHYRAIEVGTPTPPATGTGTPPQAAGDPPLDWQVASITCDPAGRTLLDFADNSFSGRLRETIQEDDASGAWADCTFTNVPAISPPPPPADAGSSVITARKWGDRASNGSNQPLSGARMGLWLDDGDGEFRPGAGDGVAIRTCVTDASGTCEFSGLGSGGYWVQELSAPSGNAWNAIMKWAPGAYDEANPPVPYAAYRYGDPAADLVISGPDITNGYPIFVNGTSGDQKVTDWFANRRTNPSIAEVQCSALLRIVLVLDRSGSIQQNGASGYREAIKSFVNDLVGTNTQIAIVSFSASATKDLASYTDVNTGLQTILNRIDAVYNNLGGGTNWDDGLTDAADFSPIPDLVLMVTDGNPTLNNASSNSSSEVNWSDFTEAVTSSNRLKGNGSRVIAVAAGREGTISVEGLIPISGPLTNQASALDDDYFLGTVDELAEELRRLAVARCGASVKVKKEIESSPGQWGPGVDWSFDIADQTSGVAPVTFTPTPPASTALNASVAEVRFEWAASNARTVTITERNVAPATDYFDPAITCWAGPDYEAEGSPLSPTAQTARSITIVVPTDEDYSCRFRNSPRPVDQVVRKYRDLNADGDRDQSEPYLAGWTVWVDLNEDGAATGEDPQVTSGNPAQATFSLVPRVAPYKICEVTQTGWTNTDPGGGAPVCKTVTVYPGETPRILEFGNTKLGSITIVKDAIPDDAQDFAFTTSGTGLSPFTLDDDGDATRSNTITFGGLLPGAYSVTETLPVAGWGPRRPRVRVRQWHQRRLPHVGHGQHHPRRGR